MASTIGDIQRLQKQLDEINASAKDVQKALSEAILQFGNQAEPRSPRRPSNPQPSPIAEDDESVESQVRPKRRRQSIDSHRTGHSTMVDGMRQRVTSVDYSDDTSDSDEGESFFASEPLPTEDLDEKGLRSYLDRHPFDDYSSFALQTLFDSERYQHQGSLFATDAKDDEEDHDAQHHDADVYEVDKDGSPRPKIREDSKKSGDHSQLWEVLRHTNRDESKTQKAVGRIVVMREPTPLLCAALHYTMSEHFDTDSMFKVLIDDKTNTRAYVNGHLSKDPRHQRSIVFMLKYHTLVGIGRTPLPWQNHDDDTIQTEEHVPISTCSAVVALSLSGKHARKVRSHSRKSRKRDEVSTLYDPFNPWHILSIQCFPDWHADSDVHETKHHYVNGPDAFLATLLAEYRDATKRFRELSRAVVELAAPSKKVVFDPEFRDDLLFEHGDFRWSRRYFWAAQVLQILIEEIQAMITAYEETFTEEFWKGEHKTLFFGTADVSARFQNFRKKITHTQKGFEKELGALREILKKCNADQKHIRMLREWLFSGTSVLESRSARKQDYNIKLLTLVTIIFLPLMFVTSVFGMTNIKPDEGFVRFGIITVCVAIPTYWFIILVQFHEPVNRWKDKIMDKLYKVLRMTKPVAAPKISRSRDRKRLGSIQKSAINTTLQRRLTSMSSTGSIGARQSVGQIGQEVHHVPLTDQNGSIDRLSPRARRPSTIRWSESFSPDGPRHAPVFAEPSPLTSDVDVADQLSLPERALSLQNPGQRASTMPRRASLLRRFSSGSGGGQTTQSPV